METFCSSSLAWFRLQESALKSEHERGLLNYKLLMHSYRSQGFKKQILGDLYVSFNEKDLAENSFNESFDLYFLKKEYFYAAIILLKLKNNGFEYKLKLTVLINELEKNKHHYTLLINDLIT